MTDSIQLDRLNTGLAALNIALSERQKEQLLAYRDLLLKWNGTYNLTALRDPAQVLSHHVFDSLSLLPFIEKAASLIDIGSGGGMPGIPVAIARPEMQVVLLDANTKKTAFLQQAVIELGLANAEVVSGRAEAEDTRTFDIVTSRAFAELKDFVGLTGQLVGAGGHWAAMKGVYPYEEIAQLPESVTVTQVARVEVPELNAERHIVLISPQS